MSIIYDVDLSLVLFYCKGLGCRTNQKVSRQRENDLAHSLLRIQFGITKFILITL